MMYRCVLFDLDGTLTDSGPGIMWAAQSALRDMGIEEKSSAELRKFVGPPLADSFRERYGLKGADCDEAVRLYRDYYNNHGGVYQNSVYPGIPELLMKLRNADRTLIIATSKSDWATRTVLSHFGLDRYFGIVAAADDILRRTKTDVIRYAVGLAGIHDLSEAVMVGDRYHDIMAAKELGIDSIGVLFGYGSRRELEESGADYIAETAEEIGSIILS
jgi:phosphoglycolate phosphatase